MKRFAPLAAAIVLCTGSATVWSADKSILKTEDDKASYALGMRFGSQFSQNFQELNINHSFQHIKKSAHQVLMRESLIK